MEQWPDSLTIVLDDWDFPENEAWQHLEGLNPNYTQSAFYKRSVMRFNQTLNKAESTAWIVNASEGADLAFYGWAPASGSQDPSTFQVIDSSGRTQMMQYSSANTLGEIFVSNASMDGFALEFLQETRIDYVLKKVSENETDLRNTTVLVDDFNSEIKWEGLWDRKPHYSLNPPYKNPDDGDLEQGSPLPVMQPHGGGTHTSTTEGDFFSFQFAGTSIVVAGVNPFQPNPSPGTGLTMMFAVDGTSEQLQFIPDSPSNPYDNSENSNNHPGYPHYIYYQNNSLEPGNHILTVNITHMTGEISAIIDYLTYNPSFNSLLEKPDFSQPIPSSTSGSTSITSTGTTTSGPTNTSSIKVPNSGRNAKLISGAVLGSVAGIFLAILLFWFRKRRRTRRKYYREDFKTPITESASTSYIPEPFVLTVPAQLHSPSSKRRSIQDQSQNQIEEWRYESRASKGTSLILTASSSSDQRRNSAPLTASVSRPHITHTESGTQHTQTGESSHEMPEHRSSFFEQTTESQTLTPGGSMRSGVDTQALESQMREIHSRVEMLSTEMSKYMKPPAYENGVSGE